MNDKKKRNIFLAIIFIAIVAFIMFIAYLNSLNEQDENWETIKKGTITMNYKDDFNGITLSNAKPLEDKYGIVLSNEEQVFDFVVNIKIKKKKSVKYEITAEKDPESDISDDKIRLYLQRCTDASTYHDEILSPTMYTPIVAKDEFGAKEGEMVLDTGTVSKTISYYYRLRMWETLEEGSSKKDTGTFKIKVNVYSHDADVLATTDESGVNSPKLVGDMIPVVYDPQTMSWLKADTSKAWYNYDNQMWANAVTIKNSSKRKDYKNSKAGTSIAMEDINTMWVWIPRYSYTLGNLYGYRVDNALHQNVATPGAFDIKFINVDTTDRGSGVYTGETPAEYYTPTAFCFGDTCSTTREDDDNIELSGIWVSKFEISGTLDNIHSIPNVPSLREQNIATYYNAIMQELNGKKGKSKYGFSGKYSSHMIKNTEWGAMAYLSQSKYGKYGNAIYTGINKEISINNCISFITGVGANTISDAASDLSCTSNSYITEVGQSASTTGNIYGVYDTSGGSWEYTMSNYKNILASSGFTEMPSAKYYDLYTTTVGLKGDATNMEGTLGFYKDYSLFVNEKYPWFYRGGDYNDTTNAGIFDFNNETGEAGISFSTRMILAGW